MKIYDITDMINNKQEYNIIDVDINLVYFEVFFETGLDAYVFGHDLPQGTYAYCPEHMTTPFISSDYEYIEYEDKVSYRFIK